MIDIINFGSINLDYVYSVEHFVKDGETITAQARNVFFGGKGLNQSIAAARAGGRVFHAGMIGDGGESIVQYLAESGVETRYIGHANAAQGHAVIQVDSSGRNSIIVFPGSNHELSQAYVDGVLSQFPDGGYLILQNEISCVEYIVDQAHAAGFHVVFNASPIDSSLTRIPIDKLSWLMINETEGAALSGSHEPRKMIGILHERYPQVSIVLTLGGDGVMCINKGIFSSFGIYDTEVVDTTAAGDTFTGYFVACLAAGCSLSDTIKMATAASAIAISYPGASPSIPNRETVHAMIVSGDVSYMERVQKS